MCQQEEIPIMEYEDEQELREAIEAGRRHKIAGEVLSEFLNQRREEIVRTLEDYDELEDVTLHCLNVELALMKKFRNVARRMIDLGEAAEARLAEDGR